MKKKVLHLINIMLGAGILSLLGLTSCNNTVCKYGVPPAEYRQNNDSVKKIIKEIEQLNSANSPVVGEQ